MYKALRNPVTGASLPHYLSANLAALTARTGVEGARSDDPLTTLRGVLRINAEKAPSRRAAAGRAQLLAHPAIRAEI